MAGANGCVGVCADNQIHGTRTRCVALQYFLAHLFGAEY
jgi:hypothetical protein